MKILVITSSEPARLLGQAQGVTRRLKLFMDALSSLASEIHLTHFIPRSWGNFDPSGLEQLQCESWGMPLQLSLIPRGTRRETFCNHYLKGMLRAYDQPSLYSVAGPEQSEALKHLLNRDFDIIFVHRLAAMCAVLRSGKRPRNIFFDLDDVEHLVRLRYATRPPWWPGKIAYAAHVPALFIAEMRGIALANQTFVCSARDQSVLDRWCPGKVAVVPNALPVPSGITRPASAPNLLFLGACDYEPNAEAAERLITNIFPIIRKAVPKARLIIAGKGSDTLPSSKRRPQNVDFLGFVGDLGELYAETRIVCCPLLNGGGTRIKLIEAAGYARPIVSTRIGAEGLEFEEDRELLIREDDHGFAQACVELLRDEEASALLGLAARARMERLYDANLAVDCIRKLIVNHLK